MRILLISLNYPPELTGIGKYNGEMAEWLVKNGHEVKVITGFPYYPHWKIADGYSCYKYTNEVINGVSVWRCPLWVPVRLSGIKRVLHLLSFAVTSFPLILFQVFWNPAIVMTIEPPLFSAPASLILAKFVKAVSWLHIQDFELDAAFDLGIIKSDFIKKISFGSEAFLLKRFNVVSTISNRMLTKAKIKGVKTDQTYFFPNWVDLTAFESLMSQDGLITRGELSEDMRRDLKIPASAIVALYSGNMGAKQGLEILAEVANHFESHSRYARSNVFFVFCGDGIGRNDLMLRCAGLKNVRFLDLQPLDKLPSLLTMADIHLLPQREEISDLVMPSKLSGMLASGRPVVATAKAGTQVAEVVDSCGIVVKPGNFLSFAKAVLDLATNYDLRLQLGKFAYRYSQKNLNKKAVLGSFEKELIRISDGELGG